MKPKFNNPFSMKGNWYKGNLHTHTTNSDGALSPVEMIREYQKNGYHFLAITDHWKLTETENPSNILLIKGEEVDCYVRGNMNFFHFVALNLKEVIPHPMGDDPKIMKWEAPSMNPESPEKLIRRIKAQGGEVIIAHPYLSALSTMDMLSIDGYIGVEIFNASCLSTVDKAYSMIHWDNLLIRGKNIFGFAFDDAHWHFNEHQPNDTCRAWIMVKAASLSIQEIMNSIRQGLFYASWGPVIKNLSLERNKFYLSTSPVKSISFIAPNAQGEKFSALAKGTIQSAEYKLPGKEKYIRVQCIDEEGRMAWTNPIFFT